MISNRPLSCRWCGAELVRRSNHGPIPRYCSDAHRQSAHRARVSAAGDHRQTAEDPTTPHTSGFARSVQDGIDLTALRTFMIDGVKLPDMSGLAKSVLDSASLTRPFLDSVKLPDTSAFAKSIFDSIDTAALSKSVLDSVNLTDTSAFTKSILDSMTLPDTSAFTKSILDSMTLPDTSAFTKSILDSIDTAALTKFAFAVWPVSVTRVEDGFDLGQSQKLENAGGRSEPLTTSADDMFRLALVFLLLGALLQVRAEMVAAQLAAEVARSIWAAWVLIFHLKSESAAFDALFNLLMLEVGRRIPPVRRSNCAEGEGAD
jgi:hypothetical protein